MIPHVVSLVALLAYLHERSRRRRTERDCLDAKRQLDVRADERAAERAGRIRAEVRHAHSVFTTTIDAATYHPLITF